MKTVNITTEYITLGQMLKFAGIINSGALAKTFLIENEVYVNHELEQRRGRKLYDSYVVTALGKEYLIEKK